MNGQLDADMQAIIRAHNDHYHFGQDCPAEDPHGACLHRAHAEQAAELQALRDADGLARDALRRSGYHFSTDTDKPLAELIEKLNADARDAVRTLGEESKRLRDRLSAAHEALTRVEDDDPDEFVTLESTVEWVVTHYRALRKDFDELHDMLGTDGAR